MGYTSFNVEPAVLWFIAMGLGTAALSVRAIVRTLRKRTRTRPADAAQPGWRRILPDCSKRERVIDSATLFALSGLPYLALAAVMLGRPTINGEGWTFVVMAAAIAAFEAALLVRAILASQVGQEPVVAISAAPIPRNTDLKLRVEIHAPDANSPAGTREIFAQVVCIEHAVIHQGRFTTMAHRVFNDRALKIAGHLVGQDRLAGEQDIRFNAAAWPASGPKNLGNQTYEWQLQIELPGTKNKRVIFPLEVV